MCWYNACNKLNFEDFQILWLHSWLITSINLFSCCNVFAGYATALGTWITSCKLSFYSQTYLAIALDFTATVTACVGFCPCALCSHSKYCRLWFSPLNGFYWTFLSWGRPSFEMPCQSSPDLELFSPWRGTDRSAHWWAAAAELCLADGAQRSLLGRVEMLHTGNGLQHPGPDPGNGLTRYHLPSTCRFIVLAARSAVTRFFRWKKAIQWKETASWTATFMFYILHTLKLLLHNASAKWMLY